MQKKLAKCLFTDQSAIDGLFADTVKVVWPEQLTDDIGAMILWGGGDIHPSWYGQQDTGLTYGVSVRRDMFEYNLIEDAVAKGIPIIGICRGAQFCCIQSGGSLFQHVEGHAGPDHDMIDLHGNRIETNSLHHQMLNLDKTKHELIAWAAPRRSEVYLDDSGIVEGPDKEPEVVWFPEKKMLAIQGHPEYMDDRDPFVQYCVQLVKERILPHVDSRQ